MTTLLTPRQESIASIAALTAAGNQEKLKTALNRGLDAGLTVNDEKEILLQMYAYTGFPKSLSAINTLTDVLSERQKRGLSDTIGEEPHTLPAGTDRYAYGKSVVEKLFGPEKGVAGYAVTVPATDTFLKEHLFADIFSRNVLSTQDRELATVSALAALGNVRPMLKAHMTGAMNTGLTADQIGSVLTVVQNELGTPGEKARSVLESLTEPEKTQNPVADIDTVFAQGEVNPYGRFFTGTTYFTRVSEYDDVWDASLANVTFEPGARTNWHTHTGGQILLVLDGSGYYQEKGRPARRLNKGDVVRIPVDTEHWHGAAPDSWFTHVSLETNGATNKVDWLEPVTDEEYNQAVKGE